MVGLKATQAQWANCPNIIASGLSGYPDSPDVQAKAQGLLGPQADIYSADVVGQPVGQGSVQVG